MNSAMTLTNKESDGKISTSKGESRMILNVHLTYQQGRDDSLDVKITRSFQSEEDAVKLAKTYATKPGLYTLLLTNRADNSFKREILNVSEDGSLNIIPMREDRRNKDVK